MTPGQPAPAGVLFVAAAPPSPATVRWVTDQFPGRAVAYLGVTAGQDPPILPAGWGTLAITDLGTLEELRREYLDYLERIPTTPIRHRATLDRLFRRRDGYSFWWTDVAVRRSPTQGMFLKVKLVWTVTRAVAHVRPAVVVLHAADPRQAAILQEAAGAAPDVRFAPESARPGPLRRESRRFWFRWAIEYMYEFTRHRLRRHRWVRQLPAEPPAVPAQPTVVLSALYPRHVDRRDGAARVWYWDDLAAQLAAQAPPVAVRCLLDLDNPDTGPLRPDFGYLPKETPRLGGVPALPLWRGHANLRDWAATWVHQVRMLYRYYRLEADPRFAAVFRFRGVDLSPDWVGELRHALNVSVWWESEVDAAAARLRECGDVRAALVHQEFEVRGMILIAACRRLGIPTVGVQHGNFYPMHTVHTPPAAQVRGAPTPDYFAAYGEYGKEVVSRYGHFPADRVWTCAGSRFDALATRPPDRAECRRRLGLPADAFVVLVTTQSYPWFPDAVRAVLTRAPADSLVCVKTFKADEAVYRKMIDDTGNRRALVFVDRFEDLLGACDVLASASSTTINEATLLAKPTVCLNFSAEPFYYPYIEEGVSLGARTADDVGEALGRLRSFRPDTAWQERRMRFLERHLGPATTGTAAATFARHVREIAGRL
ncbi:MAG: hypothetical protein J2P46_01405 [Zavarzinella sp.]|nr:hypothetical protein [Zavarzinella sp.]